LNDIAIPRRCLGCKKDFKTGEKVLTILNDEESKVLFALHHDEKCIEGLWNRVKLSTVGPIWEVSK